MGVTATPTYHRRGALDTLSGSNLAAAASLTVVVLPRGAVVDGTQSATSAITVREGHGIVATQKIMVGTDETKFFTVSSVDATTISIGASTVDVTDGDVLVNLGNDGGTTSPDYDATTVPIYAEMANASAKNPSTVASNSSGKYEYWSTERLVWEVVLASDGTADTIIRDVDLARLDEVLVLNEVGAGSTNAPTQDTQCHIYLKGDKLIIRFDNGGTEKFISVDFTLAANPAVWAYGTSEP